MFYWNHESLILCIEIANETEAELREQLSPQIWEGYVFGDVNPEAMDNRKFHISELFKC